MFHKPLFHTIIMLCLSILLQSGCVYNDENEPLHNSHLSKEREDKLKTIADWTRQRQEILERMQLVMGQLPDRTNLPDLDVRIVECITEEKFTRIKLSFVAEPNDRIPAYLFLPKNKETVRSAAILALHPTTTSGKDKPAGLDGKANQHYGLELAKRGYVVLVPDYPSFGEYKDYNFQTDRYVSGTMKGIFNHMRCIDFLQTRREVDPERIGAIGHSLGGHNSIFVGAFDSRIKVIVSSCGWTPFHDYQKGDIRGWTAEKYMPRLKDVYKLDPDQVPFDFYGVISTLAPRAFLSNSPLHDTNFDVAGVKKAIPVARKVYDIYDAGDKLQVRYPDCKHEFPDEVREEAYIFIDTILQHSPR